MRASQNVTNQPSKATGALWRWIDFHDKTLWDWIHLLGLPIILAGGTLYLEHQVEVRQTAIADNQYQQSILSQYFDDVAMLLGNEDVEENVAKETSAKEIGKAIAQEIAQESAQETAEKNQETAQESPQTTSSDPGRPLTPNHRHIISASKQALIRSKTIATLRELDSRRKGLVLQFLYESHLITGKAPQMSLAGADFQGVELENITLSQANLQGVNLRGAQLSGVNLQQAILTATDLSDADLRLSDLSGAEATRTKLAQADLEGAYLSHTTLVWADLSEARLSEAYLGNADLSYASLLGAELEGASLFETTLFETKLQDANLFNTYGAEANLSTALSCHTTLPDGEISTEHCYDMTELVGQGKKAITTITDVLGDYEVQGQGADQTAEYRGLLFARESGDPNSVEIVWAIASGRFYGVGRLTSTGDLYVTYTGEFTGDGLFSLGENGQLQGFWRSEAAPEMLGIETWTPRP